MEPIPGTSSDTLRGRLPPKTLNSAHHSLADSVCRQAGSQGATQAASSLGRLSETLAAGAGLQSRVGAHDQSARAAAINQNRSFMRDRNMGVLLLPESPAMAMHDVSKMLHCSPATAGDGQTTMAVSVVGGG